jgi:hypothetical protein
LRTGEPGDVQNVLCPVMPVISTDRFNMIISINNGNVLFADAQADSLQLDMITSTV